MASIYALIGEKEKANEMFVKMADNAVEYITWGRSLNRRQRASVEQTLRTQQYILQVILQEWNRADETELLDKYAKYIEIEP